MIYTKIATVHARKNIDGEYDNKLDVYNKSWTGCMFLASWAYRKKVHTTQLTVL